jgi:nicotinate-nucleotide adenylyltransferase
MTDQKPQAIGILGGTFDPVHCGHLRMGIELGEAFQLAKVHIIPCYQPVHRDEPSATPEQRFAMVKSAVAAESTFIADDREIRRQGPSYMIDTLLEMRAEFPTTPLCLLVGVDAFLNFHRWHQWQAILDLCHLIVAHRPQYQMPQTGEIADLLHDRLQQDTAFVHQTQAGGILLRPITALEISASEIRKQIAMRRNPRYLLPDPVFNYISEHGIYLR